MMKDIPRYNGRYKINESGVIINEKNHVMRSAKSKHGYLRVALENRNDGVRYNESVHRLVAETFIPNPNNFPIVMHLDNDKLNNHVSNLKWGTQKENVEQAFNDGLRFRKMVKIHNGPKSSKYEIFNDKTGDIKRCHSRTEVAETIGYAQISLKNMVGHDRGITQGPYKGYKIRRIDNEFTPTPMCIIIDKK